ncbi:MAG: aminotransferase class IV, partial [Bdellovibrionota bacterium]
AIPGYLLDPKIKNRSRIHYLMANIEAGQVEGDNNWALLLDPDGHVAEGSGDNFFIIKNDEIITPEGRNILRGISREYVLKDLASQLGLKAVEKNFEVYDVLTADEAFKTATPFCILPVTSCNGSPIGDGKPGKITQKLLDQWGKNVGVDIPGQIKKWGATAKKSDAPTPYSFKPKK